MRNKQLDEIGKSISFVIIGLSIVLVFTILLFSDVYDKDAYREVQYYCSCTKDLNLKGVCAMNNPMCYKDRACIVPDVLIDNKTRSIYLNICQGG